MEAWKPHTKVILSGEFNMADYYSQSHLLRCLNMDLDDYERMVLRSVHIANRAISMAAAYTREEGL